MSVLSWKEAVSVYKSIRNVRSTSAEPCLYGFCKARKYPKDENGRFIIEDDRFMKDLELMSKPTAPIPNENMFGKNTGKRKYTRRIKRAPKVAAITTTTRDMNVTIRINGLMADVIKNTIGTTNKTPSDVVLMHLSKAILNGIEKMKLDI